MNTNTPCTPKRIKNLVKLLYVELMASAIEDQTVLSQHIIPAVPCGGRCRDRGFLQFMYDDSVVFDRCFIFSDTGPQIKPPNLS